jgi:ankyrin repeat protein
LDTFQNYILMNLKFKGWTPLHYATNRGHLDCMVELLEDRANIPAEKKLQIDAQVSEFGL